MPILIVMIASTAIGYMSGEMWGPQSLWFTAPLAVALGVIGRQATRRR